MRRGRAGRAPPRDACATPTLSPFVPPPEFQSSSWDTPEFPPGILTCWVDERTGVILGLDDGRGLRCGNGEGKAVQIPLPGNKFVEKMEVRRGGGGAWRWWRPRRGTSARPVRRLTLSFPQIGIIPKTDFLGHLKFYISTYNATKFDDRTIAECGNATLTSVGFSGQGAQVDSAVLNAQRIAEALGDNKNVTNALELVRGGEWRGGCEGRRERRRPPASPPPTHPPSQELYGPHLAATRVGKCLTDRYATPKFAANKTSDSAATVAAAALASLKPTLKINSSIDAKSLDPSFTPRTCKKAMLCSPEGSVTVADSGCQPAKVGNTFVLVNDGFPVTEVACAPAGVVGNIGYQGAWRGRGAGRRGVRGALFPPFWPSPSELTAGESADCVTTNTCSIPVQAPEDNLVGGVCNVGGLESPCYSLGEGCPTGQVQVTDEAGTCTTGFCCSSPTCAVPNQLCGGGTTCVDTETDVNNCGFCGTQCPGGFGVQCAGGQCQCADGTPVVAQATVPALRQGTQKAGKQSVDSYSLGLPTANGGTCTLGNPTCTCSLRYNSYSIPDRFLVRSGGVCTVQKYDTGFTGLVSNGCTASAPCCDKKLGGGCTGTAGGVCPPNTPGISGGGGTGAGIATFTVPGNLPLFVTAYGVSDTGGGRARRTLAGPDPPFSPPSPHHPGVRQHRQRLHAAVLQLAGPVHHVGQRPLAAVATGEG